MLDDFMIRALLAGVGVALVAGPLGSVVVWKRMAFFGDALAHSALFGIALSIMLEIHHIVGVIVVTMFFSLAIASMQKQHSFSNDTLLGIFSHGTLATGLIVISLLNERNLSTFNLLFGDILSTTHHDILWIYIGSFTGLLLLAYIWQRLVLSTINPDLARIEGINIHRVRLQFMLLLSLLVALSIKIVGMLLVTSLLIIPAATARQFSRTPEQMAVIASSIAVLSVTAGLYGSLFYDVPAGPSIVVACALFFLSATSIRFLRKG